LLLAVQEMAVINVNRVSMRKQDDMKNAHSKWKIALSIGEKLTGNEAQPTSPWQKLETPQESG